MSQQEEPPFDAEAFVARMDANTAARRKAMADKPGGDAVLIVAVCRSMLAVNKPEWEPWLSNIEGLIAHIDTQAGRLATLEDEAAGLRQRGIGLVQRCRAEQAHVRDLLREEGKWEATYRELAAQQKERAEKAEASLATLLAEFVAGIQPADIPGCLKMHSEPAFGEFLRGMNAVHGTNLRWARWKAAEFGLPWPLPAAEFEFGYTNEAGQPVPLPEPTPAPAPLAGEAGPPLCAECGDRVSWGHDFSNCATCRGIARGEEKAQPYATGAPLEREDAAGQAEKGGSDNV